MRSILLIFALFSTQLFFGQVNANKEYEVGDIVQKKLKVYDTTTTEKKLVIPCGEYVLIYFASADNRKNSSDFIYSKDSMNKIESVVPEMLKKYGTQKIRIFYIDYQSGSNYYYWLQKFKRSKLMNKSPNYVVDYYAIRDDWNEWTGIGLRDRVSLIGPDGKLLSTSENISSFNKPKAQKSTKTLKGKLLTEIRGVKTPLVNTTVYLMVPNSNEEALEETKTNKYGDFELNVPLEKSGYTVKAVPDMQTTTNVILATRQGDEIAKFSRSSFGFDYKLLDVDIVRLTEAAETEDVTMKFKKLVADNSNTEIRISENIKYASGRFDIETDAKPVLDKVVNILKDNPNIKIEVISHTDSQGDDSSNLALSLKRATAVMDYLTSHGIDKSRIKATGNGETAIRNRCKNGVDCSDLEHEYNRRTEFNFIKPGAK